MKRIEIIPAILPFDFAELADKVELIKGFTKKLQVDVCDGQFVPNATWPYRKHDDTYEKIIHEEEGMPGWESIDYEFDLMVNKPEEVVEDWITAGAARIILHAEAKGDIAAALVKLSGVVEVGMALNIETPLDIVELHKERINFIQLMGIDHIGFQHQAFDEKVLSKIKEVKARFPDMIVSIDGGVSMETAPKLIEAGADRLVVGSAIFAADNPLDALQNFKKL
jgi:ribulose-phosphate 3-epimerase